MQISKRTIEILKNFASINQSIYINPSVNGKTIVTKTVASNIVASADIEEVFPCDFAIFNINEFLSALTMFNVPELEFDSKFVTIRENGATRGGLKFFFANPALIIYPKKKPVAPAADFSFKLNQDQLSKIDKAAKILGVDDLVLYGDSDGIHCIVTNKKSVTSNDFEVTLSDVHAGDFKYYFKQGNWKFIQGNYTASVTVRNTDGGISGLGFFESDDGTIKYGVSIERV